LARILVRAFLFKYLTKIFEDAIIGVGERKMSTLKKLLFIATAIALLVPVAVSAYTTVWNQKVCEVNVKEPIVVTPLSAISPNQTIWPDYTLTYSYEIRNIAPNAYRLGIGGALNGWENGQRKAWLGISAPTVTVTLEATSKEGYQLAYGEGTISVNIAGNSTIYLHIILYFHKDVEAGDWSYYLTIQRIPFEGRG
jgi:hypothetical protein